MMEECRGMVEWHTVKHNGGMETDIKDAPFCKVTAMHQE